MKNIHVLPTDKPSRLKQNKLTKKLSLVTERIDLTSHNPINIYITSNEEIKDGDWFYVPSQMFGPEHISNEWFDSLSTINAKKIILTTDQDLIKDGVQAIDDDFLQWFAKNPSCENINVELTALDSEIYYNMNDEDRYYYKIIIPKEEPFKHSFKVLTAEEVMEGRSSAYEFIDFDKQEKLSEVALKLLPKRNGFTDRDRLNFIEGAMWKEFEVIGLKIIQERMYNEEDLESAFIAGVDKESYNGINFEQFLDNLKRSKL